MFPTCIAVPSLIQIFTDPLPRLGQVIDRRRFAPCRNSGSHSMTKAISMSSQLRTSSWSGRKRESDTLVPFLVCFRLPDSIIGVCFFVLACSGFASSPPAERRCAFWDPPSSHTHLDPQSLPQLFRILRLWRQMLASALAGGNSVAANTSRLQWKTPKAAFNCGAIGLMTSPFYLADV